MKTLEDVRAHHIAEAQRYLAIGANWRRSAEAERARRDAPANAVRVDRFARAAALATEIAGEHVDLADACGPQRQAA